jgi:hypothetical protein
VVGGGRPEQVECHVDLGVVQDVETSAEKVHPQPVVAFERRPAARGEADTVTPTPSASRARLLAPPSARTGRVRSWTTELSREISGV